MRLLGIEKIRDGKYLKGYELSYENKAGKVKKFEIISRNELKSPADLGQKISGTSIVAFRGEKLLLLKEFRLGVNREIYNLCAGMLEEGESIEECIARELYEETGLSVKRIISILPPSFSAVGFSDVKTYIAFVEAEGSFEYHTSANEQIEASFYTRQEVYELLRSKEFSSRAQMAAYLFAAGADPHNLPEL